MTNYLNNINNKLMTERGKSCVIFGHKKYFFCLFLIIFISTRSMVILWMYPIAESCFSIHTKTSYFLKNFFLSLCIWITMELLVKRNELQQPNGNKRVKNICKTLRYNEATEFKWRNIFSSSLNFFFVCCLKNWL